MTNILDELRGIMIAFNSLVCRSIGVNSNDCELANKLVGVMQLT